MRFHIILFLTLLNLASVLIAQQSEARPTPLVEPLIQKRAATFATWLVTLDRATTKDASAKVAPVWGSKVSVVKTDNLYLQSTLDERGQVWTTWCMGRINLIVYPDKKNTIFQDAKSGNGSSFYTDYSNTDFPEFSWISQLCYAGTAKFKDQSCLVFTGRRDEESYSINPVFTALPGASDKPAFDPDADSSITAYINSESRLPVAFREGQNIRTFTFLAPPAQKLQLPPMVQEILDQRAENMRALVRILPKS